MVGFAVIVGASVVSVENFFNINMIFGFLTGFLISSFSMIVNDYYDIDVDRINSPNRPLVKGDISLINAKYLAIMFLFLGILSALYISLIHFAIASIFSFVSWYYNFKGKKYGLIGNFLVSLSISIPYIYGGLIHNIYDPLIMVLAGITFLASTGREIIKTISDVEGDKLRKINSISIVYGVNYAAILGSLFFILAVIVSLIPIFMSLAGTVYSVLIILPDSLFIYLAFTMLQTRDSKTAIKVKKIALLGMLLGLLCFIFGGIYR
jgi:geranylgeranylglycerol-phosphate geranylgeranyltransferase